MAQETKREKQLKLHLPEEVSQGAYANLSMVNHTETEFVFDFCFVQPQDSNATVRSRILSSPLHTKRFLRALAENVERYEARFGVIDVSRGGAGNNGGGSNVH